MLFNSIDFICYLVITIGMFFSAPLKFRWLILLGCSYFFYGYWNVKYLLLILITTLTTYLLAILITETRHISKRKKILLSVCIINFGFLAVFKYANFFSSSINSVINLFQIDYQLPFLNILLPVGISFYTFQAIGYILDVYKGDIAAERNLGIFALYITFFPQLVAGPIERSRNLLPQFRTNLKFDYNKIINGLILMTWGFFQKLVIADRLAIYVNSIFSNPASFNSLQIIIASYFFSFQIYCDFAGYSNIAIGTAKIFGIDLMSNFNRPYFAKSVQEFWRRWHISLSTWFRDYLYIPLGGNRVSSKRMLINIMIVFVLCGLWHGAAWTFVVWGGVHGLLLSINIIVNKMFKSSAFYAKIPNYIKIFVTFNVITFAWIIFRAPSIDQAFYIISRIFSWDIDNLHLFKNINTGSYEFFLSIFSILFLITIEKLHGETVFNEFLLKKKRFIRWGVSYFLVFTILLFGIYNLTEFIYFQF